MGWGERSLGVDRSVALLKMWSGGPFSPQCLNVSYACAEVQ